ncbi:MAG: bifunctional folylpolyglutamate synthase/dihydrofolate synthase [Proteobacteria bacterium]|nr:bifunctional folylpolyglutamate synthase/dihydrofolate synthase [Pseudomonadota bacterium]MBU1708448.1 bifunctional folylpolyglutamate synthase/dihydrofolate synthase [Pseudomonadota bacterium]
MNYKEAWSFLDNLQFFKIKLGLESMSQFLESVGQPQEKLRFIHVAGTNGKGSVAATLLTLLSKAGYKTGLYTSPHLSSVRERFRINDAYISQEDFAQHAGRIREILNDIQITYFEFTTALALLWFADRQVDIAIMEVGLGGRLDATNVITPLVSIITNVSMDHEAYLGNTLEEIASEKAGIIKPGIPVVSGVAEDVSREVVIDTCDKRHAPLYVFGRDFSMEKKLVTHLYHGIDQRTVDNLLPRLKGNHQTMNTAVALAALEILEHNNFKVNEDIIRQGLSEVHWPGRLEYFRLPDENGRQYLLDGAHNPAGIISLVEALAQEFSYERLILVWACMSDKDIAKTLSAIAPISEVIIFTMPESERSATPEKLTSILAADQRHKAMASKSVAHALDIAAQNASEHDLICVAGSLYLVGAARKILQGELISNDQRI